MTNEQPLLITRRSRQVKVAAMVRSPSPIRATSCHAARLGLVAAVLVATLAALPAAPAGAIILPPSFSEQKYIPKGRSLQEGL